MLSRWLAAMAMVATLTSPAAANYGPILGRGSTGDKMIVHWGSDAAVANPTVTYRLKGAATMQTVTAATSKCDSGSGKNKCDYEVTLTGLAGASAYEYAINGAAIDGSLGFSTCPAAGAPLDVVFYGDSRSGGAVHKVVVDHVIKAGADIVLESGDIQLSGSY